MWGIIVDHNYYFILFIYFCTRQFAATAIIINYVFKERPW